MSSNISLFHIDNAYIEFLRLAYSHGVYPNKCEKNQRPYVGPLFRIEDFTYFAPMTSNNWDYSTFLPFEI